jgi:hypothetical protein
MSACPASKRNRETDVMETSGPRKETSPSQLIDERIRELGDWRGKTLARLRALIKQADPDVVEEWKWRGVPVWYHDGMICTGETYKSELKLTFVRGPRLTTHQASLTRASRATPGAPSTSMRGMRSTGRH